MVAVDDHVEAAGMEAFPLVLDLRSLPSIERAMADITARFAHLDLLVNNAATNLRKLAVDVTAEEWDEVMATNLRWIAYRSPAPPPQTTLALLCSRQI